MRTVWGLVTVLDDGMLGSTVCGLLTVLGTTVGLTVCGIDGRTVGETVGSTVCGIETADGRVIDGMKLGGTVRMTVPATEGVIV